jgi:hypothetical protein
MIGIRPMVESRLYTIAHWCAHSKDKSAVPGCPESLNTIIRMEVRDEAVARVEFNGGNEVDCNHPIRIDVIKSTVSRWHAVAGVTSASKSMPALLAFVSFAPTLGPFGEGTEMRCVLHACVSYVFNGTLARRKKTVLSKLAIKLRVRHDTPLSPNTTRWPLVPGKNRPLWLLLSPGA